MKKQVLIISNPDDLHTQEVAKAIIQLGCVPVLFYPEALGTNLYFSLEHNPYKQSNRDMFSIYGDLDFDLDRVHSVWYRRPRLVALAQEQLVDEKLDFARDEWRSALSGIYALLRKPFWVSHPEQLEKASNKPLQLKLAGEIGLRTPHTLITNDVEKARDFFSACSERVIVKPTGVGWVYAKNTPDLYFVMTNRIEAEDLQEDGEIRAAPVTFQEEIPKLYELRVNVVGQKVLAIKIESQKSPISALDWRRYDVKNTPYSPYQLPEDLEIKCLEIVKRLGLEFGALDFIRQPDGQYVFLEINGNGQFLWAEELSGVKVSKALANLLVGAIPPLSQYGIS